MTSLDPWKTLDVRPSSTVQEIRRSWLRLVKKHHPDRGKSPEERRRRTIRTAQLNWAYEEALREKNASMENGRWQFTEEAEPRRPNVAPEPPASSWVDNFVAGFVVLLILLLSVVGVPSAMEAGLDWIDALKAGNPVKILVLAILSILAGGFMGFFLLGTLDAVLYGAVFWALSNTRFLKYHAKVAWCLMLLVNGLIVFNLHLYQGSSGSNQAYATMAQYITAFSIPAWLFFDWLRDLILFRRARRTPSLDTQG